MNTNPPPEELQAALTRLIEGEAEPRDDTLVAEMLRARPELRAQLQQQLQLDALLRLEAEPTAEAFVESVAARTQPPADDAAAFLRRVSAALPTSSSEAVKKRSYRGNWFSWRPLTAAAAGLVIGLFGTSVVLAYAKPKSPVVVTEPLPLADAGFELGSPVPARGIPARAGVWSGDFSRVVVAELGVTPKQGQRMLRFLRSDNGLSATNVRSYVGEVAQVIDLRPLRADLAGGAASVELSALFNSIPSAAGERYEFAVKTAAFRGDMAEAPRMWTERDAGVSRAERASIVDGDPATWQRVSVPLAVPEDVDFLVIECAVVRKHPRVEHAAVEFPGHYVDQVELRLSAPRTSTIER